MRQVSAARRAPAESCLSLKDSFPRALAYVTLRNSRIWLQAFR